MLIKVAEKKVNKVLAMKAEAVRMAKVAEDELNKVVGEIYTVADGMRSQANLLEQTADKLSTPIKG